MYSQDLHLVFSDNICGTQYRQTNVCTRIYSDLKDSQLVIIVQCGQTISLEVFIKKNKATLKCVTGRMQFPVKPSVTYLSLADIIPGSAERKYI